MSLGSTSVFWQCSNCACCRKISRAVLGRKIRCPQCLAFTEAVAAEIGGERSAGEQQLPAPHRFIGPSRGFDSARDSNSSQENAGHEHGAEYNIGER